MKIFVFNPIDFVNVFYYCKFIILILYARDV